MRRRLPALPRLPALSLILLLPALLRAQSPSPQPAPGAPSKLAVSSALLIPDPLDPKTILSGRPDAATRALHNDPDGKYAVGIWKCTPGSFRWTFGRDEFVYVIEGEATVTYANGKSIPIHAGDAVYFPKGETTWKIIKPIKKVFAARE